MEAKVTTEAVTASRKDMSLQELIEKLHILFADERVNVDEVNDVLSAYQAKRSDWEQYAIFDTNRYTRNLVDEGNGRFNLIVLCWVEGQGSGIHDHADSHCFMKVLDGNIQETLYGWPKDADTNEHLEPLKKNIYSRGQVAYINDSIGIHRVENPSHSNQAVTLHLYSPAIQTCRSFDERTGKKRTCKVTFWSKYGVRTPFGTSCAPYEASAEQN